MVWLHQARDLRANEVVPGLWQGAAPPPGRAVRSAGFRKLVLCAEEYQPPGEVFDGMAVLHAPNDDSGLPISVEQKKIAILASRSVARSLLRGEPVLVTCMQGRNRSGLVSALTLIRLGVRPEAAIRTVQRVRPMALSNGSFVSFLRSCLDGDRRRSGDLERS